MKNYFEIQNTPCSIDNIFFLEVMRNAGFSISFAAGKSKCKFIYIKSGSMRYVFGSSKEEIILESGNMLFIPGGSAYTAAYLEDDTRAIHAQFDLVYGRLPKSLSYPQKINIPGAKEVMQSLISCDSTDENREYYRISRVYELIWKASDNSRGRLPDSLMPAINDMKTDQLSQHKVSYYAGLCCMSESSFRRSFTEHMGLSPIEYRNRLRIGTARTLIASGEYSVADAAASVGFSNVSFFCRCYKRIYGHTPRSAR